MKLMWFPFIKCTLAYLHGIKSLESNYNIGIMGSINTNKDCTKKSSIEIDWDTETDASDVSNNIGEVALYVVIKNRTDGTNMLQAYEEQYLAQTAILDNTKVLHDLILRNLRVAVKISAAGVAPLGTSARPIYGNQLVLLFQWKK